MFDTAIRRGLDPAINRLAAGLDRLGIGADAVTLFGLVIGVVGAVALAFGAFGAALGCLAVNRLCDGLDGAIARRHGGTQAGGFLDITADFIIYAAYPLAFAVHDPAANALPAACLLAAFLVNGAAFLAFAIAASARPEIGAEPVGKAFHYLWGLTEGAETIAFFVAMLLLPAWFPALALVFAILCAVSGAARITFGYRRMKAAQ